MRSPMLRVAFLAVYVLSVYAQTFTTIDALGETVVEVLTLNRGGLPTTEILSTVTTTSPATSPTTSPTTTLPTTTLPTTTAKTATTTSPTTTATTTTPLQQGPVGQPPATTAGGGTGTTIAFQYTTTNAAGMLLLSAMPPSSFDICAGATVVEQATFIPTFAPTTEPVPASSGTILDYSEWLGMVGTNTVAASSGVSPRWTPERKWFGMAIAILTGVVGGAWLVMA
ncbi:hypothetical protein AcV5_008899 [Taiwanofungus camphoratus]|nr:hypothetical protein AcV5_008899 [Antrodia cinnamomea]KAI0956501.1 hypothetical protein AcV7_006887 [Antrodia cinnamomea]